MSMMTGSSLSDSDYGYLTARLASFSPQNEKQILINGFKNVTIYDSTKNSDFNTATAYNNRLQNDIKSEKYISDEKYNQSIKTSLPASETIYYDAAPISYYTPSGKNYAILFYTKKETVKRIAPIVDCNIIYGIHITLQTNINSTAEDEVDRYKTRDDMKRCCLQ
jgi:hypothetical protein